MFRLLNVLPVCLVLGGCAASPNSIRAFAEIDGPWVASVSSVNCAITQTFNVDISGRAFGVRIPDTDIFLSGVVKDRAVRTEFISQEKVRGGNRTGAEISAIDILFETSSVARGTWRASRCSGDVTLRRRGAG